MGDSWGGLSPWVLDLYCCAGGATRGYQRAGFKVFGVDINDQPDYPGDEFLQCDALEFLTKTDLISTFGFVLKHASPPCQGEGTLAQGNQKDLQDKHPRLIEKTRDALNRAAGRYIIENVNGSGVRKDMTLCGEMFGLGVIMHRHFEFGNWKAQQPPHKPHRGYVRGWRHKVWHDGPYVAAYGKGGGKATVPEMQKAKGIDWTSDHLALREALPPAYTQYIGEQLWTQLNRENDDASTSVA